MGTVDGYQAAVILINRHEPEGEVAARLMEIADEKDYDLRAVEASRGEHDVALSFRVPKDVAEEFEKDRADRWPSEPHADDDERLAPAGVDQDAFEADQARAAQAARVENGTEEKPNTARSARAKAKE